MGSLRVGHDWSDLAAVAQIIRGLENSFFFLFLSPGKSSVSDHRESIVLVQLSAHTIAAVYCPFFRRQVDWPTVVMQTRCSCCCCSLASVISDFLWSRGLQPTRLLCPWDSLGKNTGVGCHAFLQGILPTGDWTKVSCIAGRFFYLWVTREALKTNWSWLN